jgi:hypothetical protein
MLIVNVSDHACPGGFFENHTHPHAQWHHFATTAPSRGMRSGVIERFSRLQHRWAGCYRAARWAVRHSADWVITHDPRVTYPTAIWLRNCGYRGKHLAFSFNYDHLPSSLYRRIHRLGFSSVDRFVVFSSMERTLYHRVFGIPIDKIDFVYWGVNPPTPDPADRPLEEGEYICAIGGNSRDYRTLLAAMQSLPPSS